MRAQGLFFLFFFFPKGRMNSNGHMEHHRMDGGGFGLVYPGLVMMELIAPNFMLLRSKLPTEYLIA